ncbi:hypothetical protein J31TS4_36630 [Paenibacillus sp. J31TS4]|uniref:DUF1206 domain-containing protein n=1 Tax=Paenibacillus sp. J31TS4 TaxID=2807195 RepID=UPI001AFE43A2|nr:DUF1206 domain-containing protein [Paenibacillus sp. J31TS4]GIP40383.1 hypothetical protein J31TS4_36630 [Paenibacillus sp. J31TS4]
MLETKPPRTGRISSHVKAASEKAEREAAPWIDRMGQAGFAAKGIVYLLIGLLAVLAACGTGGRFADTRGVLELIEGLPLGEAALTAIAFGLAGYAVWRFAQAIADPDRKGRSVKGIAARIGYAGSGLFYGGLAFTALRLAWSSQGGGKSKQGWAAELLRQPLGEWMLGGIGAGILVFGGYQLVKAASARFADDWKREEMSETGYRWGVRLGRLGESARGVVFGIVGVFLLVTAWTSEPRYTKGIDGALAELAAKPYGSWLVGFAGAGLMAYGVLLFVYARYRRLLRDRGQEDDRARR